MTDPLYQKLRERAWRRKLTPAEEAELRAWLAAHPEAESDWDGETGLNTALTGLPNVPVPSNFTARVLAEIHRPAPAEAIQSWPSSWKRFWRPLLPKAALALVVVSVGLFSYERHVTLRRAELARRIALVSSLPAIQDPDVLQNFETIRQMDPLVPDEKLIALMQFK